MEANTFVMLKPYDDIADHYAICRETWDEVHNLGVVIVKENQSDHSIRIRGDGLIGDLLWPKNAFDIVSGSIKVGDKIECFVGTGGHIVSVSGNGYFRWEVTKTLPGCARVGDIVNARMWDFRKYFRRIGNLINPTKDGRAFYVGDADDPIDLAQFDMEV